jgi:hypothetical protein
VAADQYVVGAAYGGAVSKQYVKAGDVVSKGEKLFTVQSVGLQQDVSNGVPIASSDAYDVNVKTATVTYKATVRGQVTDLKAKLGNALASSQDFAKISVTNSQYVDADYLLSPGDYSRVEEGAAVSVLLPNNQSIPGTVSTIRVSTDSGKARTEVRVDSDQLKDAALGDLAKPGTPVVATLDLRDDGPLAGASGLVFNFLRTIGLK